MRPAELSLDEVELLLAFAGAGNATEAARRVGLSQPAFNERLRRLESRLQPSPFAWEGNKRILSQFGSRLVSDLEPRVVELRRSLSNLFLAERGLVGRPLRVAGRNEVFQRLAVTMPWFSHPLELRVCSSQQALTLVESGECDVALSVVKPAGANLVQRRLFFSTALFVVNKSLMPRRWRAEGWPDRTEAHPFLTQVPWLSYSEGDRLHGEFLLAMGVADEGLLRKVVCDDWQVLWRLVRSGVGAAVLPAAYVDATVNDVFRFSPSAEFQRNPFYLVTRREIARHDVVRAFVDFAGGALS
jgi:DNA-binding transcriptional LysR family regulator